MHFFVTGGTGFLGSHFIATALCDGHDVTALRRPGSRPRIPIKREPNWCEGNLDDPWSQRLEDCDVLVHLAAAGVSSDKENWEHCFQVNVGQSLNLWQQAVNAGIRKFLICGSCFEYGLSSLDYDYIPVDAPLQPMDAYSASKAAATVAALGLANRFDLQLLVARPFHLYGDGEAEPRFWPSLVRAARVGKDFPMSHGEQVRDFMHVKDAAKRLLQWSVELSLTPSRSVIRNLGSGLPKTLEEFARFEWDRLSAKGKLLIGDLPYRKNEMMRYVPLLN